MTQLLHVAGKPLTVNGISKSSYYPLSKEIRDWREAGGWAAKAMRLGPAPIPCKITVMPWVKRASRAKLPDAGAPFFACKAVIDSLVDVGVLVDDSPQYVFSLTFRAPQWGERDALSFLVEPAEPRAGG